MPEHLPVARAEAARVAGVALTDAPTATGPRSWANAAWVALAVLLVLITVSGVLSAFLAR